VGDGVVLRSSDGGRNFSTVSAPAGNYRGVRFAADGQFGVIVGDGGQVLASRDGGASWSLVSTAPGALHGVSVSDDGSRILAVGERGLAWRSGDGGATFSAASTGASHALNAVGFDLDVPATGWAVGDQGTVLVTHDAGLHFEPIASPILADFTAVEDF
jgi:photosystem II stability/assembly factor-like uncharacterized protein